MKKRIRKLPAGLIQEKIICLCGCGESRDKYDNRGRERKYIDFHRNRLGLNHGPNPQTRGENHYHWKGGRYIDKTWGYVMVYVPGHPMANTRGYVKEHRLVMEDMLGRVLETWEIVHHINHVRTDNHPENLELMTQSSHSYRHRSEDHSIPQNIGKIKKRLLSSR